MCPACSSPRRIIGGAAPLFNDQGKLVNDTTRDLMRKFMHAFNEWVGRNVRAGIK